MPTLTDIDLIKNMLLPGRPPITYASDEDELIAIRDGAKPISMFQVESAEDRRCVHLVKQAQTLGLRVVLRTQTTAIGGIVGVTHVYVCSDSETWRVEALSIVWEATTTLAMSDATAYIRSRLLGYSHEHAHEWARSRSVPRLFFLFIDKHRSEIAASRGRFLRLTDPAKSRVFYPVDAFVRLSPPSNIKMPKSLTLGRVRVVDGTISQVFSGVLPQDDILLTECSQDRASIIDENMSSNIELMSNGSWQRFSKY